MKQDGTEKHKDSCLVGILIKRGESNNERAQDEVVGWFAY
jgi:hypothetical protein